MSAAPGNAARGVLEGPAAALGVAMDWVGLGGRVRMTLAGRGLGWILRPAWSKHPALGDPRVAGLALWMYIIAENREAEVPCTCILKIAAFEEPIWKNAKFADILVSSCPGSAMVLS